VALEKDFYKDVRIFRIRRKELGKTHALLFLSRLIFSLISCIYPDIPVDFFFA
jgi:hypothetical protein